MANKPPIASKAVGAGNEDEGSRPEMAKAAKRVAAMQRIQKALLARTCDLRSLAHQLEIRPVAQKTTFGAGRRSEAQS
jgi:hypothetical protein